LNQSEGDGQLTSWLDFFSGAEGFNPSSDRAIAEKPSGDELTVLPPMQN
jgi:hypothetical protein